MENDNTKTIVITGTSSGIGYYCVKVLDRLGFNIFAALRKEEDFKKIKDEFSENVTPIHIDLNNYNSVVNSYDKIKGIVGSRGIYCLINNAATAVGGPIEYVNTEELNTIFQVNVFGQIKMIQTFLPLLREGNGRIINISSTNGWLSMPYMGLYCASKYALEAISDALRIELIKWQIPVSVICPDKIQSNMWSASISKTEQFVNSLPNNDIGNYYKSEMEVFLKAIEKIAGQSLHPKIVVRAILHILNAKKPKFRYLPGFETKLQYYLVKIFPQKMMNRILIKLFGLSN